MRSFPILALIVSLLPGQTFALIHRVGAPSYQDGSQGLTVNNVFYPPPKNGSFNAASEFPSGTGDFYQYVTSTSTGNIGSGQTWTSHHPVPWLWAGYDFSLGPDSTITLKNPLTNPPAGCTPYPSGHNFGTNPELYCNGGNNLVVTGYEFGINAAVGTTSCVILEFGPTQTGSATSKGNHFGNGPGCLGTAIQASISGTTLTVTQVYYGAIVIGQKIAGQGFNDIIASGIGTTITSQIDGTHYGLTAPSSQTTASEHVLVGNSSHQLDFDDGGSAGQGQYNAISEYDLFDGHARSTDTVCGGIPCDGGGINFNHHAGFRTVIYDAFLYMPARPMGAAKTAETTTAGLTNGAFYGSNYFEGVALNAYGVHGEMMEDILYPSATLPNNQYSYNTYVTPNQFAPMDTPLYFSSGGSRTVALGNQVTFANSVSDHNTIINNSQQPGGAYISAYGTSVSWNNFGTVTFDTNYMDVTGILYCYALVTSPTVGSTTFTGNKSLNTGNVMTGYGIAPGNSGCN
jgi:hypothetical protein